MPRIIDVVDHVNVMDDEFTYREPQRGSGDWRLGSQVIVGESQVAVFVRGGEALDSLGTGRHTLSTMNIPLLAGLIGLGTRGRTPFTADLYFINLKDMPQVGWGTNPPIVIETPGKGYGVALLQTFGTMNLRVADPMRFLKKFGVAKPITRLGDLKTALQTKLLGELGSLMINAGVESIPQANSMISDIEGGVLAKLSSAFEDEFGLQLTSLDANPFQAKTVSEDEIINYVDSDMWDRINQRQIMRAAAENEGAGGSMVGAGLGVGIGQQMGATINPQQSQMQQQQMQQQQMMNNMMMQKMMEMMGNQDSGQSSSSSAPAAAPATRSEIEAAIDQLDMRFMNGEISEDVYNRLLGKWQTKLDGMV